MKYNKPVFVQFNQTHRKLIQDGLLRSKAVKLEFNYTDFGSGNGTQIYLTAAQLKRLQAALTQGARIEMSIPNSQLSDTNTGFMSILAGKSMPEVPEESEEPETEPETEASDDDSINLSEAMKNVDLSEPTDGLVGVGLSASQRKRLCSSCGTITINLAKTGLTGDDYVVLSAKQQQGIANAQQKGTGVRLTLEEAAYDGLKKSQTS